MAVTFNTIPRGIKSPLFYVEFDNSMANLGDVRNKTLLIGQMLDGGKAKANKPVLVTSAAKGNELFGRGSQLARMNAAYRQNDAFGEVWAIPVADPTSGVKASGTIKVTGTAESAGMIYVYVADERVPVPVANKATNEEIAYAIKDAINSNADLPVSASAASGSVTLSARGKGEYGNDIILDVNRYGVAQGEELPEGVNVQVTKLSGGTGEIDIAKAIAAMGDEPYEVIVFPFADKDALDKMSLVMNDQSGRWSPFKQIFGHVFSAKRGDVETLSGFGKSFNDQHLSIVGVEPALPAMTCEVLAAYAARTAVSVTNDPAQPTQTLQLLGIKPYQAGEGFTLNERQTLMTSGIATTMAGGSGICICRGITTYQRNAYGDVDVSYLDSETLFTLAYVIRKLRSEITSKLGRHKLASDGTAYGPGQAITTPSEIKTMLIAGYRALEEEGIVEKPEMFAKFLIVERDKQDPNRVNVVYPPDLVNQLRVVAIRAQFRLEY